MKYLGVIIVVGKVVETICFERLPVVGDVISLSAGMASFKWCAMHLFSLEDMFQTGDYYGAISLHKDGHAARRRSVVKKIVRYQKEN